MNCWFLTLLTVGSLTETKFTSFENLFVGGIVGQQVGNKMTNSMVVDSIISVNIDDKHDSKLECDCW